MNGNSGFAGAGGVWPTERDLQDPRVIAQEQGMYCGCACALMMCAITGVLTVLTQDDLHDLTGGRGYNITSLAETLNEICPYPRGQWVGRFYDVVEGETYEDIVRILSRRPWIAQMQEPMVRGHFVVVEAYVNPRVHVLDPASPGTSYRMRLDAFVEYWTGLAVNVIGE